MFFLSIFMPPGKFPESWIMNHGGGGGAEAGMYPSLMSIAMSTPFVHNSVYQPITPNSSLWFRIVVIVQVGFISGVATTTTTTLLGS
jgi:hypothetical protein